MLIISDRLKIRYGLYSCTDLLLALLFLMDCFVFPLFGPPATVACFPLMWNALISVDIHWNGTQSLTAVLTLTLLREPFPLMNTWTERQLFGTISLWWQQKSVSIPEQQHHVLKRKGTQSRGCLAIFLFIITSRVSLSCMHTHWISEFVQRSSNHQED